MLQAETAWARDAPFSPSLGSPSSNLLLLSFVPFLPLRQSHLHPSLQALQETAGLEGLLMEWPLPLRLSPLCLPSLGAFLATWEQQLPFSWPHLSSESPALLRDCLCPPTTLSGFESSVWQLLPSFVSGESGRNLTGWAYAVPELGRRYSRYSNNLSFNVLIKLMSRNLCVSTSTS